MATNASRNGTNDFPPSTARTPSKNNAPTSRTTTTTTTTMHSSRTPRPARTQPLLATPPPTAVSLSPLSHVQHSFQTPPRHPRTQHCGPPSHRKSRHNKLVFMIRHGQSLGQAADLEESSSTNSSTGDCRRRVTDHANLRDCGLSTVGRDQAKRISQSLSKLTTTTKDDYNWYNRIDLVVTSPLRRALETTLLAFGTRDDDSNNNNNNNNQLSNKRIICHYDLREVGSSIPENIPSPCTKQVVRELLAANFVVPMDVSDSEGITNNDAASRLEGWIDVETFRPPQWPHRHDTPPKVVRRDRIRTVFSDWLLHRPEEVIAVVSHFHVIRAALDDPWKGGRTRTTATSPRQMSTQRGHTKQIVPENAIPIPCELDVETGRLRVLTTEELQKAGERFFSSGQTETASRMDLGE